MFGRKILLMTVWVMIFESINLSAAIPQAPVIALNLNQNTVKLSWVQVPSAQSYTLFYAPYPNPTYIGSLDMGKQTDFSVTFSQDAQYYVALKASNTEGSSNYSNIEHFVLPEPIKIDPNVPPLKNSQWYRPQVGASWQWQLKGTINTSYPVEIYDIDLFDTSLQSIQSLKQQGKKVICYFSAGTYEGWRPDKAAFKSEDLGKPLEDFQDERWLDIRSLTVYQIMTQRLDLAVSKGCDGVEPDNVDAYINNSGFALNATDQLAFNKYLANAAHQRNLSVALKNDLDQAPHLLDYFDFSVNEQCHEYDECHALKVFIESGKPVLNAEYDSQYRDDVNKRQALCELSGIQKFSTLILPVNLDDQFRFSCQ